MYTEMQRRLRSARRHFNITQRELAVAVGLTATTISNYEIGTTPSVARFRQLMKAIHLLGKADTGRPDLRVSKCS
jgi:transcriptional regulator with XRE-family HTH domain